MPQKIACVLFDYGDVISRPQEPQARKQQAGLAGLTSLRFDELWRQYRPSYDQGVINGPEYWSRILAHSRTRTTDGLIAELIQADIESWRPTVGWILDWAEKLRKEGILTGVLSNMPPELVADTREQDWIAPFDPLFFSAEIKENKPYGPIYEHVIRELDCHAREALFIDDKAENVRGAIRAGLNAVQHRSREATLARIESDYVLPTP